jgi:hypothetical protein
MIKLVGKFFVPQKYCKCANLLYLKMRWNKNLKIEKQAAVTGCKFQIAGH